MKWYRLDGLLVNGFDFPEDKSIDGICNFMDTNKICAMELQDESLKNLDKESCGKLVYCKNLIILTKYFTKDEKGVYSLSRMFKLQSRLIPETQTCTKESFWIIGLFAFKGDIIFDKAISIYFNLMTDIKVQFKKDENILKILTINLPSSISLSELYSEIFIISNCLYGDRLYKAIPISNKSFVYLQ